MSKEIWDYLLSKEITITAEYLPGLLNVEADTQSRTVRDVSKWKVNPRIFLKIYKYRGTPEIDLFASRISHQLLTYISWKLDPYSQWRNAFQISWTNKNGHAFPPLCLILKKDSIRPSNTDSSNPRMANTVVVPSASAIVNKESLVTSKHSKSFDRAKQTKSSVDRKTKLATPGMDSFREKLSAEGLSEESAILIANARRPGTVSHYELPGVSGIAGVFQEKLIPLDVL